MKAEENEGLLFALGRFIDYRLKDGMGEQHTRDFKQTYLNLSAELAGKSPLALSDLEFQTEAVEPTPQYPVDQYQPYWLSAGDKQRLRLSLPRIHPEPADP